MMHGIVALIVPIIIVVVVALIIDACAQRFAPDPLIATIVRWIVFAVVLIYLLTKLLPLLGMS